MSRNNGDKARFGKQRKKKIKRRAEVQELRRVIDAKDSGPGTEEKRGRPATV